MFTKILIPQFFSYLALDFQTLVLNIWRLKSKAGLFFWKSCVVYWSLAAVCVCVPVHLYGQLIFLTKLIFVLLQLLQSHALVRLHCRTTQYTSAHLWHTQSIHSVTHRICDRPTDCGWWSCSSSSSSAGASLGGRMPFFLRMSFHSVSAFGSYIQSPKHIKHTDDCSSRAHRLADLQSNLLQLQISTNTLK